MAAGYITFRLIEEGEEIVDLGGAGWTTWEQVQNKWDGIVDMKDDSIYVADLEDVDTSLIETKIVHADVIEACLGKPISELIIAGKAALEAELKELRG